MKKNLAFIILLIALGACNDNKQNKLLGKWQEYTTGVNGQLQVVDLGYKKYFVIDKLEDDLTIVTDYDGAYEKDTCDNVFFDGTELTFRKHNKGGDFNHYKLSFDENNMLLVGQEKSWNDSIYEVKYKKVKP